MRTVYALVDPVSKELRYVGCTTLPLRKRLRQHVGDAARGRTAPVWRWIRDAGCPEILPLEQTEDENAEIRWIAELREAGFRLLNVASGGPGCPGVSPSAETRAKLAAYDRTPESRARMSESQRGNQKAKGFKNALGHRHTPETKARLGAAAKGNTYALGYKHTPEALAKMKAARLRRGYKS